MLCDAGLDSFGVGTVYNINLFSILKVMERRNRSYTLSLHQFRCFWGSITNNLKENGIGILFTETFELGCDHLAGTTPTMQLYYNDTTRQ